MVNVLIALDDSPVSIRAAREAVRLFSQTDSRFFVINVATLPVPWVGAAGFGAVTPMVIQPHWLDAEVAESADRTNGGEADAEAARAADAADGADRIEDERLVEAWAAEAGVPHADVEVRAGDAVIEICRAAEEHDVDVIVVGSHDKSALRRLFDPSVASGVVRTTHRPVLVVSGEPPTEH